MIDRFYPIEGYILVPYNTAPLPQPGYLRLIDSHSS